MTDAAVPCAACGNVVSALAKYCPECGAATARQRPDVVQGVEGELRQLTVVFSDLVGSTELSTRMDPEEFGDVIHRYLQRTAEVIRRFEGTWHGIWGMESSLNSGGRKHTTTTPNARSARRST